MNARISQLQRARFQRPMRRGGRPRGGRPARQHDHRQQAARRPQLISEMLKAGQEIIVQIAKEPLGKKGARHRRRGAAALPLPGLHAHGEPHWRIAAHRFSRGTLAPSPSRE